MYIWLKWTSTGSPGLYCTSSCGSSFFIYSSFQPVFLSFSFSSLLSLCFCPPSLFLSFLHLLLLLSFLLPPPDVGARWSSNGVYREPAFTTSEANRQVSSAFCPTEGLSGFPSMLLSITAISNGFIRRKPSTFHRLPRWAVLASFLLPLFDVCRCSTSSLLLSKHFGDNWFRQR